MFASLRMEETAVVRGAGVCRADGRSAAPEGHRSGSEAERNGGCAGRIGSSGGQPRDRLIVARYDDKTVPVPTTADAATESRFRPGDGPGLTRRMVRGLIALVLIYLFIVYLIPRPPAVAPAGWRLF